MSACEALVSEILRLQELRGSGMKEVNVVLTSYEAGQMQRDEMLKHLHSWQEAENRRRSG